MDNRPAVIGGTPILSGEEAGIVRPSIADYTSPELMARIQEVLVSNQVTNGVNVRGLEENMGAYLNVDHVVAVSSCTLGLTLALQAAGIVEKEVILPSFTIAATANAAYWNRCKITFADIDLDTFNISLDHVEELITEETGAIMPVHVFGNPCRINELQALGSKYGVPVVYDAAQAFGASYQGAKVGRFGEFEVFSGSPTKHFTSLEGGFIATNDGDLAEMVRLTRNYGVLPNYDCVLPGLNARMPEINAVVGQALLPDTDGFVSRRNRYAEAYREYLVELPGIRFQEVTPGACSSYNYFGMLIEPATFGLTNRELEQALKAEGIGTKVYYHPPVHLHQAYRTVPAPSLPYTQYLADRIICLPMYNSMEHSLLEQIATAVLRIHRYQGEVKRALSSEMVYAD
ncbi:MAG: DegT/DnrJ/EryC1/StrS family aminotransferase [Chloroflexi bacterium]|nr:DegT/DnrJ/EryC1/StrS family aminotransferase [Chloroflexota bacterium]